MQQFVQRLAEFSPKLLSTLLLAISILILGLVTLKLIDSALKRVRSIVPSGDMTRARRVEQRAETLRHIVRSVGKTVLGVVLVLLVTGDLGFNIDPLLAISGIAGLAIGFGAQSLVKDLLAGFFVLLEDQYGVGDAVRIGLHDGVVEDMTLRVTVLRNFEGQVHIIPNGTIQTVTVLTKDWSRAVIDLTLRYNEDLHRVFDILARTNEKLANDMPQNVLEKPKIMGIERLSEDGVTVRLAVKTPPFKQGDVLHEWRLRIKDAFENEGIEMPRRNTLSWGEPAKEMGSGE